MSTDLGKSFNGVKLISSTVANPFNNVLDFWIKSDGSVIYALTNDTVNVDLWRYASAAWQRITILPVATYGVVEIVRSAQSDTNAIYVARPANNNRILKSADGGTTWLLRSCTQNIADLALQSATVAYVASAASAAVLKTANGCTSWTTVGSLAGVGTLGYSINLIADNKIVVGGTAGYAGYYDGAAWTAIAVPLAAGNVCGHCFRHGHWRCHLCRLFRRRSRRLDNRHQRCLGCGSGRSCRHRPGLCQRRTLCL